MSNLPSNSQPQVAASDQLVSNVRSPHNFSKAILLGLIFSLFLAAAAFGGYWYTKNYLTAPLSQPPISNVQPGASQPKTSFGSLNNQTAALPIDEAANWKDYTSTTLGITFKYPKEWYELESSPEKVVLVTTNPKLTGNLQSLSVTRYRNAARMNSRDWWRNFRGDQARRLETNFTTDLTVDARPALRENPESAPEDLETTAVFVSHDNWVYAIEDVTKQENFLKKTLFDQILSTFKFLDKTTLYPESFYDFVGGLELHGYLTALERKCGFTAEGCQVNLAVFNVLDSDNPKFLDYLKQLQGNAYVTKEGVVLGCIDREKKEIRSENDGDDGLVNNLISGGEYDILLASTKDDPLRLNVTRPKYTTGRGAPDCYSHFRNFRVSRIGN